MPTHPPFNSDRLLPSEHEALEEFEIAAQALLLASDDHTLDGLREKQSHMKNRLDQTAFRRALARPSACPTPVWAHDISPGVQHHMSNWARVVLRYVNHYTEHTPAHGLVYTPEGFLSFVAYNSEAGLAHYHSPFLFLTTMGGPPHGETGNLALLAISHDYQPYLSPYDEHALGGFVVQLHDREVNALIDDEAEGLDAFEPGMIWVMREGRRALIAIVGDEHNPSLAGWTLPTL